MNTYTDLEITSYKWSDRIQIKRNISINQFCEKSYISAQYFEKYKNLIWLACSVAGNKQGSVPKQFTKAEFDFEGNGKTTERELTYFKIKAIKNF